MAGVGRCAAPPTPIYILRGSDSPVTALEFADDVNDGSLLSGCQNGNVHAWDLTTRRSRHCFDAHQGNCVLFVTSAHSDTLMTQGRDGYFKTWKCPGAQYVLEGALAADMDGFCSAVLLPQENSTLVALPGQGSTVQLTDLRSRSCVRTLNPGSRSDTMGLCMCLSAVPNQTGISAKLAAGYESGKMVLWDVGSGKLLDTRTLHEDAVMCACFGSARLNKGLAGSVSETLVAWTVSDKDQIETVREVKCTNPGFNAVTIRPDDRIAAAAGWDKQVRIFNTKSMRPLAVLAYHRESVRCVSFSKDHLLAVGSNDHLISLWDIYRK